MVDAQKIRNMFVRGWIGLGTLLAVVAVMVGGTAARIWGASGPSGVSAPAGAGLSDLEVVGYLTLVSITYTAALMAIPIMLRQSGRRLRGEGADDPRWVRAYLVAHSVKWWLLLPVPLFGSVMSVRTGEMLWVSLLAVLAIVTMVLPVPTPDRFEAWKREWGA